MCFIQWIHMHPWEELDFSKCNAFIVTLILRMKFMIVWQYFRSGADAGKVVLQLSARKSLLLWKIIFSFLYLILHWRKHQTTFLFYYLWKKNIVAWKIKACSNAFCPHQCTGLHLHVKLLSSKATASLACDLQMLFYHENSKALRIDAMYAQVQMSGKLLFSYLQ
jgi:hypothetical protein